MTDQEAARNALTFLGRLSAMQLRSEEHPVYVETMGYLAKMAQQPPMPGTPNFAEMHQAGQLPDAPATTTGRSPNFPE